MDAHRWEDRYGMKWIAPRYDGLAAGDERSLAEGVAEEILRLAGCLAAEENDSAALRLAMERQDEEIALLRRERALLIELEKARTRILASIYDTGGRCATEDVQQVGELLMAVEAIHLEASGGVQRPAGVPCACVLCRPEGVLTESERLALEDALARGASAIGRSGAPGNSLPPNEVGVCRACGERREIFEGRCHDCISVGRRGKV